jgi:polyisoprenoid-binding protein YceI
MRFGVTVHGCKRHYTNRNRMKKSIFSAFLLACAVTHLAVAAETYEVDPVHSFVLFKVSHLGAGYVYGRFTGGLTGTLSTGPVATDKSAVELEVKTDTLDTGFAQRDKDIKSPDFLNAKQFPLITFKSTSVQKVSDQQYTVTGDLTFHGVTKPVTVQANITGQGKGPKGELRTGVEVHFTVKRSEYDVKYGLPALGDDVKMTVAVEGVRK